MGQRVLVTGGTGFIGSHLLEHLSSQGYEPLVAIRASSRRDWLERKGFRSSVVDFLQPASWQGVLEGVQTVYHLAGATAGTPSQLMQANRDATHALVKACSQCATPPTLVHVSSLAAAGPSAVDRLKLASENPAPISAYGRSKFEGEKTVLSFASRVPMTIVRPVLVFGPRDTEIAKLYPLIRWLGIHPVAGYRHQPLTFIHVTDLVQAIVLAAEYGERCSQEESSANRGRGIYYLGDSQPLSFRQFADFFQEGLSRRRLLHIPLPLRVLYVVAWVSEWTTCFSRRKTVFNRDKIREASAAGWLCDVAPAMKDLRWKPAMPIADRIRQEAVRWKEGGSAW